MWRKGASLLIVVLALLLAGSTLQAQQQVQRDRSNSQNEQEYDSDYTNQNSPDESGYESNGYVRVDRYLDADIWVNRNDNEYFIGDNIKMHYRLNEDAYVAIISIDSRGRVNLLYPTKSTDNPWRRGGQTYTLPGGDDDFDLMVDGPEGSETIQILASRERFPIPDWFDGSGIFCNDDEDRNEFMDYLVSRYFDRYPDQRFAVDREVIWVNEWEQDYFRPVYYPTYPSWSVCGNAYFDYPWGASIYVDGIYWGCAPMYIPRILVGWRTITVYDRYGYCWEDYVHVSHYSTIVLNQTVIHPRQGVQSKYKEVRVVGYRDPVKAGYANYNDVVKKRGGLAGTTASPRNGVTKSRVAEDDASNFVALPKKHLRGDGAVIRTDRGYESSSIGSSSSLSKGKASRQTTSSRFDGDRSGNTGGSSSSSSDRGNYGSSTKRGNSGSGSSTVTKGTERPSSSGTSDYYRKKTGSVERKKETPQSRESGQSQQQVEQRKPENKGSDNSNSGGSRSGSEVKQKSGSNDSGGGSKQAAPRSSGGSNSGGNSSGHSGGNSGKGKR